MSGQSHSVVEEKLGLELIIVVFVSYIYVVLMYKCILCDLVGWQQAERSRKGKSKHSQWRNYDNLNEYFWYFLLQLLLSRSLREFRNTCFIILMFICLTFWPMFCDFVAE